MFTGHAPMAINIPFAFLAYAWNADKQGFPWELNPDFVDLVRQRFATDDTILLACRSGGRAALAIDRLARAGFTNVYNILDGMEGSKVDDPDSVFHGMRLKNGWKASGLPWTYDLDPTRMALPERESDTPLGEQHQLTRRDGSGNTPTTTSKDGRSRWTITASDELGRSTTWSWSSPRTRPTSQARWLASSKKLVDGGLMRVLDLLFIKKDADGSFEALRCTSSRTLTRGACASWAPKPPRSSRLRTSRRSPRRSSPSGRRRARLGERVGGAVRVGAAPIGRPARGQRTHPDAGDRRFSRGDEDAAQTEGARHATRKRTAGPWR